MRVLLVRHAADRLRAGVERRSSVARRHPVVHLGQYVPMHGLPRHRRRGRGRDATARASADGGDATRTSQRRSARASRAASSSACSAATAAISTTSSCRACCTPASCAVLTRTPKSYRSTPPRPAARPAWRRCSPQPRSIRRCEPFVAVALHRPGHRSAPQRLLAAERALWQGQPVAVVVAESRAEAEDAGELVDIEWEPLPAVGGSDPGDRAGRAGHPSGARRQRRVRFLDGEGRAGQGVRGGGPRDRGGASLRAPDGDDARDARPDRRLQSGRRLAHRHPCPSVAVSDAGDIQPASGHSGASRSA